MGMAPSDRTARCLARAACLRQPIDELPAVVPAGGRERLALRLEGGAAQLAEPSSGNGARPSFLATSLRTTLEASYSKQSLLYSKRVRAA